MSLETMEQRTEGMKKQAQELIEQAYQRGYTAGYSKAENDYYAKTEDDRQATYELGLDMAWGAASKIIKMGEYCRKWEVFPECGDGEYPFGKVSASEAIERIHAYEEKNQKDEDEIKIGDEVVLASDKSKGIVIQTNTNIINIFVFFQELGETRWLRDVCLVKTGRTFPGIAEVLKKMQEGE